MVVTLTGCDGGSEESVQPASAQAIIDGVLNALNDITTSRFDITMTMEMSGEIAGEKTRATIVMDFTGMQDHVSRDMRENISVSMVTPATEQEEMSMTLYFLNDEEYILMEAPGVPGQWIKSKAIAANWNAMNPVTSQAELLRGAETELTGSEMIHGVDCYVLHLSPDIQQLWQVAMQQSEVTGEITPDIDRESLEELFRSYSVTQWIAQDTYQITRVNIDMNIVLTPESVGFPDEEGTVNTTISIDLLMYDYNRPVSIVLPPEAEGAIEMSSNMEK